jgi:phage terminase large subunit GpA-like protein
MALLDEAPYAEGKVARGKRMTKTRKVIAGVPLRLAHAGSSTALKSDPAALALTDEADEMLANVKGQGDPDRAHRSRGETYADFVNAIVSTPSEGPSDVERRRRAAWSSGRSRIPPDVESTIWRSGSQGTRYHWAWPCPHCEEYFIPRFRSFAGRKVRRRPRRARAPI